MNGSDVYNSISNGLIISETITYIRNSGRFKQIARSRTHARAHAHTHARTHVHTYTHYHFLTKRIMLHFFEFFILFFSSAVDAPFLCAVSRKLDGRKWV